MLTGDAEMPAYFIKLQSEGHAAASKPPETVPVAKLEVKAMHYLHMLV